MERHEFNKQTNKKITGSDLTNLVKKMKKKSSMAIKIYSYLSSNLSRGLLAAGAAQGADDSGADVLLFGAFCNRRETERK